MTSLQQNAASSFTALFHDALFEHECFFVNFSVKALQEEEHMMCRTKKAR